MRKIFILLIIIFTIISAYCVSFAKYAKASKWAEQEIENAYDYGLMTDYFDGMDLTQNMNRIEIAQLLAKLYENLTDTIITPASPNPFTDTNDVYVLKCYKIGIMVGTSETTFDPELLLNKEQVATLTVRTLTKAGIDTSIDLEECEKFDDDGDIHGYAKGAVYFMSSTKIIKRSWKQLLVSSRKCYN